MMGCYVSKVGKYVHGLLLTVTISMIADDPSKPQSSKNNDFYNYLVSTSLEGNGESGESTPTDIVVDRAGAVKLSVCARVFDAIRLQHHQSSTPNSFESQSNLLQDMSCQLSIDATKSATFIQDVPLIIQPEQSSGLYDQLVQNSSEVNIPGSTPLVVVTNPVGIVAAVTVVATILVVDRLAQMGLIDSGWSLARMKENIFGVKVYEGDQYYKNWGNPKNLERHFPPFPRYQGMLPERAAFEREMNFQLNCAQNMLEKQSALKKLQWPDKACEKLLNVSLKADPIYISENEEMQLDARLTQELANCRDSAIRSMKENIAALYNIFESLGNELIHQLKSSIQDLLNFKIDAKLIVLLGIAAIDRFQADDFDVSESDDQDQFDDQKNDAQYDDCLSDMNKKSIVKLFTNGSEYQRLLEDFEQTLDITDQFFQEYSSRTPRFTTDQSDDLQEVSVESIIDFVKDEVADKKESVQARLKKIEEHYKNKYQSKSMPNLTKYLKKSSANRLACRNRKIEERLQSHEPVTIDIESLLSFEQLQVPLLPVNSLDFSQEIKAFIDDCLQGRYHAYKK